VLTINDVRQAVIDTLSSLFPAIVVSGEEQVPAPEEPYVYVNLSSVTQTRGTAGRFIRTHAFDLQYYSSSNQDRHSVADQMYEGLEWIDLNGTPVQETRMKHEILDKVMHFYVEYDVHVKRADGEAAKMQTMKQEGKLKNG